MIIARRYICLACLLTAVASAGAHPRGSSRLDRAPKNSAGLKETSQHSCNCVDMDLDESNPSAGLNNFFADGGFRIPAGGRSQATRTVLPRALRFAGGQSEPVERVLADTTEYVTVRGANTRCGKYFVLETTKYGEFEVKQVRVAYLIPTGVAVRGLYYDDLAVVLDEARKTPVLLQKRENPGLEKDTLELSRSVYEEAKACLPPPAEPSAQ